MVRLQSARQTLPKVDQRDPQEESRKDCRFRGFATTVILTLSFCLAINVVIFAIVDSVLLRPLPVSDADAIVLMSNRYPKAGVGNLNTSSRGDYYDRLQKVSVFQEQAMFRFADQTLNIGGMPERILSMVAPTLRIGSTLLSLSAQRGQFVTQRLVVIYPFDRSNPVLRE